jgi:hypothetical protein
VQPRPENYGISATACTWLLESLAPRQPYDTVTAIGNNDFSYVATTLQAQRKRGLSTAEVEFHDHFVNWLPYQQVKIFNIASLAWVL